MESKQQGDRVMERVLEELQSKLEFQEHTIVELNGALVQQQHRMDRLERTLQTLLERMRGDNELDDPGPESPPPHY